MTSLKAFEFYYPIAPIQSLAPSHWLLFGEGRGEVSYGTDHANPIARPGLISNRPSDYIQRILKIL